MFPFFKILCKLVLVATALARAEETLALVGGDSVDSVRSWILCMFGIQKELGGNSSEF